MDGVFLEGREREREREASCFLGGLPEAVLGSEKSVGGREKSEAEIAAVRVVVGYVMT